MNAAGLPWKILIVEDEGVIAAHLESRLSKTGYQVVGIADSSDDALAKVAELTPDLVLMDIRIKGPRDGVETVQAMRGRFDLPVIYLTSHSDRETIDRAKRTGPAAFLTKPVREFALADSIDMALYKREADRQLDSLRSWTETALGVMEESVAVLDAEGLVRHLNPAAERLTGWSAAEARGLEMASLLRIEKTELRPLQAQTSPECLPRGLMAHDRAGRQFALAGTLYPSAAQAQAHGVVVVFHDATVLRSQEETDREAACHRAAGLFARGVAHDFNNLLTVILGCAQLIRLDRHLGPSGERALDRIDEAGAQAGEIAGQLLQFSAQEPLGIGPVDLNETIGETEALLRCAAGPGVECHFELCPQLKTVLASKGRLKQILMNLVVNAGQAMEHRTMEHPAMEHPAMKHPAMKQRVGSICVKTGNTEDSVELTISDTGCGMSEETAARMFEPRFSTHGSGTGRGIGLSLVRGIVDDMGGAIRVESRAGEGTRFIIRIPGAPGKPPQKDRQTVLLLEKDATIRDLLVIYLAPRDCSVLTAASADEAWLHAHQHPSIDLLIADVSSPNQGSLAASLQLVAERPQMKVLFLSGHDDEPAAGVEYAPGSRQLRHPFTRSEFEGRVSALLSRDPQPC